MRMTGGEIDFVNTEEYKALTDKQKNTYETLDEGQKQYYNVFLNEDFKKWYANREHENKNSSYKNLSRKFRGMFKSETPENLEQKFLDSPLGKEKIEDLISIIKIKSEDTKNQEIILEEKRKQEEKLGQIGQNINKRKQTFANANKELDFRNNLKNGNKTEENFFFNGIEFKPEIYKDDNDNGSNDNGSGGKRRRRPKRKY